MFIRGIEMNGLISEDYLMHHGVKGMKWGVRHDPELRRYGSREDAKSYKYNKSGESGWKGAQRAISSKKPLLTDKQKQIAKKVAIGAAITGGILAGAYVAKYGGIRSISLSPEGKAAISKGAKYLRMAKTDSKIAKIAVKDAVSNSKIASNAHSVKNNVKLAKMVARNAARNTKLDAKIAADRIGQKAWDKSIDAGNAYRNAKYNTLDAAGRKINDTRTAAAKKLYKAGDRVAPKRTVRKTGSKIRSSTTRTTWNYMNGRLKK